ncbi:MAG: hypothetical protein LUC24_04585 [Bacteroidales bacterium]|nr:hypothetical protein [Bacteroidales bacterium]
MTRGDFIKYCRYYKGEDNCPFKAGSNEAGLWEMEQRYIEPCVRNGAWDERCENRVKRYIEAYPNEKNIYTDKNVSIHTKGIAYYIEQMSAKWNPYGPNWVLSY